MTRTSKVLSQLSTVTFCLALAWILFASGPYTLFVDTLKFVPAAFLVFLAVALYAVGAFFDPGQRLPAPGKLVLFAFLALVVSVLPSSFWRMGYNRLFLLCVGVTGIVAAWFVSVRVPDDQGFVATLVLVLAAGTAALSVTGVLEQLGLVLWRGNQRYVQVYTFFANPNLYSGTLILILPFCAVVALSASRTVFRIGAVAAFALGFVNLLLTQSRASLVAFAVSLVFCGFCYARFLAPDRRRAMRVVVLSFGAAVLLALVAILLLPVLRDKVAKTIDFVHSSRIQAYQIALALWLRNPLSIIFGNGLGSFPELYFSAKPPFYRASAFEETWDAVHNELLERLVDGGVLGLAVFLAFLALFFVACFKAMRNEGISRSRRILAWGVLFAGTAFVVDSMVSTSSRVSFILLLFFVALGLLEALSIRAHDPRSPAPRWRIVIARIIPVALLASLLPALAARFESERYTAMALGPSRDVDSRLSLYKGAVAAESSDVNAKYLLARQYLDMGQYVEAVKTSEKVEKDVDSFHDIVLIRAVAELSLNDLAASRKSLDRYLERDAYNMNAEKFAVLVGYRMRDREAMTLRLAEMVTGDFVVGGVRRGPPPVFPDDNLVRREGDTLSFGGRAMSRLLESVMSSPTVNFPVYFFRLDYLLGNIYETTGFPDAAQARYIAAEAEYTNAMRARATSGLPDAVAWQAFETDSKVNAAMKSRLVGLYRNAVERARTAGDTSAEIDALRNVLALEGRRDEQERLLFLLAHAGRFKELRKLRMDIRTSTTP